MRRPVVRSYAQRCGLAKALDIVGDRWTLLIFRELLIRSRARYTDLRSGLPGIATNLLAQRLRELEAAGLIKREEAPPPIATTVYLLTERGHDLEEAVLCLGRWGAPLLKNAAHESLQPHWIVLPLRLHLRRRRVAGKDYSIELLADRESIAIGVSKGQFEVRLGTAAAPDAIVSGSAELLLKLFTGKTSLNAARRSGVRIKGNQDSVCRILACDERS